MADVGHSSAASLMPGDVHVRYRLTDDLDAEARQTALSLLSSDERARYERFRQDDDRREFAAAHALLRTTLSEFDGISPRAWRFDAGPHGKPALAGGQSDLALSFNLSHTRGLVACAVALGADVGLDVERVTRAADWRAIALRHFSPAEVAQIDGVADTGRATRFFELWTLKEAYAKALGVGLSQSLDASSFDLANASAIACTLPSAVDAARWHFALYTPARDCRLAVAVSDGSVRRWQLHVRAHDDGAVQSARLLRPSAG
jgi:4'-phosphopantetheinyl transferase